MAPTDNIIMQPVESIQKQFLQQLNILRIKAMLPE